MTARFSLKMTVPWISVILPVRNVRQTLPALLDQLNELNYPPDRYEILVVDRASSDGTADLVRRRYSRSRATVRVIECARTNRAAGRNAGIRAARGTVVVFLPRHCVIPSRSWLADTAAVLEESGAACLSRPESFCAPAATPAGEAIAHARASWLGRGGTTDGCARFCTPMENATVYRRAVFEEVGDYDETFGTCEDLELNTRVAKAGIVSYCDPRLAVHEQACGSVHELMVQMARWGWGMSRWMRIHPDGASMAEVAPAGLVMALLVAVYAWIRLPVWTATFIALPLVMFPVAVLVASLQLGLRHGVRTAWRAPWIFTGIYLGLGIGLLTEYAFGPRYPGERAARWEGPVVVQREKRSPRAA